MAIQTIIFQDQVEGQIALVNVVTDPSRLMKMIRQFTALADFVVRSAQSYGHQKNIGIG